MAPAMSNWPSNWTIARQTILPNKLVVQSWICQCKVETDSVKPSRDELELELERLMEVA